MSISHKIPRSSSTSLSWLCALISLVCCGSLSAQLAVAESEWPQFLGSHRNGLSDETGLIDRFPEQPKILWRVPGGVGMSGLSVSRGRVLTMVQTEGKQWLVALDSVSGKQIWRTAIAPEYRNPMGDGPRATPSIAGNQVFVFTGEGILAAVDFQDGSLLWSAKPLSEHSGKEAEYGMACSPLVINGELVVVTVGAPESTLVAYDFRSGKERWKAGNDPAGYSSPAVLTVGGRPQIVAFTGDSAMGVDIRKGTILWRYPFETNYQCNIATPIAIKDQVFLSAGENHGSVLLALKPKEDRFEVEPVWSSFGPSSVMRNEWQTSLLLDGYLYGMDNVGGAGPITHLKCIQADTGKLAWQQLRFGKGNLIAADGKLWITTMKGELVIVRASPDRFEELGRAQLLQSTRQSPALSQGHMYLRDDAEIICLDVSKK